MRAWAPMALAALAACAPEGERALPMVDQPPLSGRQVLELGWAQAPGRRPSLSFGETAERKRPGTVRLGLFGCSVIYGAEAARGHELPTFLQARLRREGYGRVEIVNFGEQGYGFHQAHRLWELLGERYGLDYSVSYWMRDYRRRDETFQLQTSPAGTQPHGRYILHEEGARWLAPLGRSFDEAKALYGRALQPWLYWRYDARAPNLLRRWSSRTAEAFWNPFYYRRGEHPELWRRLTARKAAAASGVVLGELPFADEAGLRALTRGTGAGYVLLRQVRRQDALHRAPENHASALGNRLRADELFAALTGRPVEAAVMSLRPLEPGARSAPLPPLGEWSDGALLARGRAVARLVRAAPGPGGRREPCPWPSPSALVLWDAEGEPSLLPWPLAWPAAAPVTLSLTLGGRRVEAALGQAVSPDGRLAHLSWDETSWSGEGWRIAAPRGSLLEGLRLETEARLTDAVVSIGGRPALRLTGPPSPRLLVFEPVEGERLVLRAVAGQYADLDVLGRSGEAYFGSTDGRRRAALGRYAFEDERMSPVGVGVAPLPR